MALELWSVIRAKILPLYGPNERGAAEQIWYGMSPDPFPA